MYFVTALLAWCAAIVCAAFSLIGGLGWLYLGPTAFSVLCLAAGIVYSLRKPIIGACISLAGAVLCGFALIADMTELIRAIPFHRQPQQVWLLVPPSIFLVILLAHVATAAARYRSIKTDEMWKSLGQVSPR